MFEPRQTRRAGLLAGLLAAVIVLGGVAAAVAQTLVPYPDLPARGPVQPTDQIGNWPANAIHLQASYARDIATYVAANLGTPAFNLINATGLPLSTGVTGTLPSANVSGAYPGITGVGTLASGSIPSTLVTGQPAPVNLASNTQWEVMSANGSSGKFNIEGTGTMGSISVTSNSTGSNSVTFNVSGSTGELKAGDLVAFTGSGLDPCLTTSYIRVTHVTANTSFTGNCPLGLIPSTTSASTAVPTQAGGASTLTSGDGPDGGWVKNPSTMIWREDNAVNILTGAVYALGVNKRLTTQEYVCLHYPDGHPGSTGGWDATRYRGQTLTFGAWVYQKVKGGSGTWQVFILTDGTFNCAATAPAMPASSGYQWETVTCTVPADATYVYAGVYLNGNQYDTYYIANPVLAVANSLSTNSYNKTREFLIPYVHTSPSGWVNGTAVFSTAQTIGYGFSFDLYAETGGAIAPTILASYGQLEGIDAGAVVTGSAVVRSMAWYNQLAAPELSGGFLPQYATNVKSFTNAFNLPLDGTGHAMVVSGVSGDTWTNVSLEFDWYVVQ